MSDESFMQSLLKGASGVIHTEDIVIEAVRDLVKDEIKRYVREKLEASPELKQEMKEAIGEFIEAKVKEAYALLKIAKTSAKLGLELVPPHLREEMAKEIAALFEKEIGAIIEKTL